MAVKIKFEFGGVIWPEICLVSPILCIHRLCWLYTNYVDRKSNLFFQDQLIDGTLQCSLRQYWLEGNTRTCAKLTLERFEDSNTVAGNNKKLAPTRLSFWVYGRNCEICALKISLSQMSIIFNSSTRVLMAFWLSSKFSLAIPVKCLRAWWLLKVTAAHANVASASVRY